MIKFNNLWDNHMHCSFSADSTASPEAMIFAAKEKGLAGITFTDHIDYDYPNTPDNSPLVFEFDLDEYFSKQISLAARETTDEFSVQVGLELGLQPHLADRYNTLLERYNPDVVIGSTHVVHGIDPYYPAFIEGRNFHSVYTEYYEAILENITAFSNFDTLGHLDYAFRYMPGAASAGSYDSLNGYEEIIDAILEFIIKKDIALEVNTGPYRSGIMQPNPAPAILRRYKQLGGKLITIGADAHKPAHVAIGFEFLPEILHEAGFKDFAVFKNRKITQCPL